MTEEEFENRLPVWAKDAKDYVKELAAENFMLWAELDRMRNSEAIHEETNQLFEEWTESFFKENGLEHLIKPYHDYIGQKIDEEDQYD